MWLSVPARVTLLLPFSGIDVYIQPDWWICQSCVTPAVSAIVHLLPCKIELKWGNPSVEAPRWTLIKFTARRREAECDAFAYGCRPSLTETAVANEHRKHFNPPPGMLVPSHFKRPPWAILSRWKHSIYRLRRGSAKTPRFERLALRGRAQWGKICSYVIFLLQTKLWMDKKKGGEVLSRSKGRVYYGWCRTIWAWVDSTAAEGWWIARFLDVKKDRGALIMRHGTPTKVKAVMQTRV